MRNVSARAASIGLILVFSAAAASPLCAADDTWTGAGPNPIWTSAFNWSTDAPPGVGDNVIMLGPGNTDNTANVGGAFPTWTLGVLGFAAPAPSFTIHIRGQDGAVAPGMTISGGVINFSVNNQFLEVDPGNSDTSATPGSLHFTQSASVLGGGVQIDNNGGTAVGGGGPKDGGMTTFSGTSSAGPATINNFGAMVSPVGSASARAGQTVFEDNALAGTAVITNFGGTLQFTLGGTTTFKGSSDAVTATITNFGATAASALGGLTSFQGNATAGGSTILNGGSATIGLAADIKGQTSFSENASAGHANITNAAGASAGGQTTFGGGTGGNAAITNNGGNIFATAAGETLIGGGTAGNAIINNQGGFVSSGLTRIFASAGDATINNNAASQSVPGQSVLIGGTTIFEAGTANNATINNNGASTAPTVSNGVSFEPAGTTFFHTSSTAGNATINNNGGIDTFGSGGKTQFDGTSTAATSTIINNGGAIRFGQGGQTTFNASSDAGASTLIANAGAPGHFVSGVFIPGGLGGVISFNQDSTGGTARVEVFGNGGVDVSGHNAPGVTIGSLEGNGFAALGGNNLGVGSNNRNTTFSGTAEDGGGAGGTGGSLTKIGTGTLTLSGNNTYTGATTVNAGKLIVDGSIASSSNVTVAAGASLGGHGAVSNVNGAGTIAPGDSPGILTATQVDPSAGMSFTFELTKTGSPSYDNAAASGNDLLHLTGLTPFIASLTSANQITVDFSGASLAAGQSYLGGFFTDAATATSMVSGANFVYTGTGGFTVTFDGFVVEPIADFASGTIFNGTVLEFDISGTGTSVPSVPEPPTRILLLFALSAASALRLAVGRAKHVSQARSGVVTITRRNRHVILVAAVLGLMTAVVGSA